MSVVQIGRCHHCDRRVPRSSLVGLWDGKTYCVTCFADGAPILFRLGLTGQQFTETLPNRDWVYLRVLFAAACATVGVSMLVGGWEHILAATADAGIGQLILVVIGFVFCTSLFALALLRFFYRLLVRSVSVENGVLRIRLGWGVHQAPLDQCRWHVCSGRGLRTRRRHTQLMFVGFPVKFCGLNVKQPTVTCGYSPETLAIWEDFFTFARVPAKPKLLHHRRPDLADGILYLAGLIGGVVGLAAGAGMQLVFDVQLVALAAAVAGAILGCAMTHLYRGVKESVTVPTSVISAKGALLCAQAGLIGAMMTRPIDFRLVAVWTSVAGAMGAVFVVCIRMGERHK